MSAAIGLAEQGFDVSLVEKESELGGIARQIFTTMDGKDVQDYLKEMKKRVMGHPRITVLLGASVTGFSGYVGNFKTELSVPEKGTVEVEHGVAIVATGGAELKPQEYLYGSAPQVVTQLELEEMLAHDTVKAAGLKEVVMIQCVGSRNEDRPYCSRVCCAEAVKNGIAIKTLNPATRVVVLYRDMRTYGLLEEQYARARKAGVLFLRYDEKVKPEVTREDGTIALSLESPVLGERLFFHPDLLVLSTATVPADTAALAALMKVPRTTDGFFLEAHMKLRPVDFATDGIYLCGVAHSPKRIDECLTQAAAAVSRACTVLSKDYIQVGGVVSVVDKEKCAACLSCVRVCPYNVPVIDAEGTADIEIAKCQGCGLCASECPARAISLQAFTDDQIIAKTHALFHEQEEEQLNLEADPADFRAAS